MFCKVAVCHIFSLIGIGMKYGSHVAPSPAGWPESDQLVMSSCMYYIALCLLSRTPRFSKEQKFHAIV